ncbi:type II toxin-antitoxin system VapC family toxin [Leptolyngbya sp. FACHB-17]|uniref:PIN domain-containing protein n=1 Tax=unclassified Leptolyngbya TaxID=2650499 RepID=UPI001F550E75|nr:type II toxin-antitoxin system VapC family toxin [Leptolyngbya sp. FACHB-17]
MMVRYLTRDDEAQWRIANDLISGTVEAGETCLINNIVLCELIWVLRSRYKVSRTNLIDTLERLLKVSNFVFENKLAIQRAVLQMKQGNADFSDYLIVELNQQQGCTETVTFDAKLGGLEQVRFLS